MEEERPISSDIDFLRPRYPIAIAKSEKTMKKISNAWIVSLLVFVVWLVANKGLPSRGSGYRPGCLINPRVSSVPLTGGGYH
jgi:hypothetical protein